MVKSSGFSKRYFNEPVLLGSFVSVQRGEEERCDGLSKQSFSFSLSLLEILSEVKALASETCLNFDAVVLPLCTFA